MLNIQLKEDDSFRINDNILVTIGKVKGDCPTSLYLHPNSIKTRRSEHPSQISPYRKIEADCRFVSHIDPLVAQKDNPL